VLPHTESSQQPLVPTARSSAVWSQPTTSLPLLQVFATLAFTFLLLSDADGTRNPRIGGLVPCPFSQLTHRNQMLFCSANLKFLLCLKPFLLFFERHFLLKNYAGGVTLMFFSCCHSDFPTAMVFLPTCF